jgi:hypothetical protein
MVYRFKEKKETLKKGNRAEPPEEVGRDGKKRIEKKNGKKRVEKEPRRRG